MFFLENKGVLPIENCVPFFYILCPFSFYQCLLCESISKQKKKVYIRNCKEDSSGPINIYSYVHGIVLYLYYY